MLVATFGPTTGWEGREIIWDVDRFILVGHGAVPAVGVLDYDRLGQLVWAQPELRAWVAEVNRWETGGRPSAGSGGSGAAVGAAAGGAAASGRRGLPTWAIVLIVLAVALIVVSAIAGAIVVPLILRTAETVADDAAVRSGVRTVQVGVESYAVDHGGQYPPASEVNGVGLNPYISAWPVNPFTDLPMTGGGGTGYFLYYVSADGLAYELVGFGREGQIVIDLTGGSVTSV
jgi:competence protein ComGC